MELSTYLDNKNKNSSFQAMQDAVGGTITFSNSGKRGTVKSFSLGLRSFSNILQDINSNIVEFSTVKDYDEKPWRDLGSEYYQDAPANAMSTVQTKPLFSTISKIIAWANYPSLEDINTDQYCPIEKVYLEKAIIKISELEKLYNVTPVSKPKPNYGKEIIVLESNTIRDFALSVFKYFYDKNWPKVISETVQKPATLGTNEYTSLDFSLFKRLIAQFDRKLLKQDLITSNTQRYFDEPIYTEGDKNYYFTTQWNAVDENGLSFKALKKHFEEFFKDYKVVDKDNRFQLLRTKVEISNEFNSDFHKAITIVGIKSSLSLTNRFVSSLLTKPFVILTGLSGSGKTKLAQAFAMWISENETQYKIVPVGADWTNREPLLGYPNALLKKDYVRPDSGVLDLILAANEHSEKPYFLILDEMNLSHVERYFADFLSTMESGEEVLLHAGDEGWDGVPAKICLPKNLFIVGTVNIDETTYMFSPKVLDRANVIEFRVTEAEMAEYLKNSKPLKMDELKGQGAAMGTGFLELALDKELASEKGVQVADVLLKFFTELKKAGAEFGYRSASEIKRFAAVVEKTAPEWTTEAITDAAIMQKLLPKLHGSRRKLEPVLKTLIGLCTVEGTKPEDYITYNPEADVTKVLYPVSLEKIQRMYRGLIDNGFTSYAEA